jgi:hypothetical protein
MFVLVLPCISSRVFSFLVASPCLWEAAKPVLFVALPNENRRKSRAKMLVLLFLRVLSSPRVSGVPVAAVSVQEAAKPILFEGFQACHVVLQAWHFALFVTF